MYRIRYVLWNEAEAAVRGAALRAKGFSVTAGPLHYQEHPAQRASPPDAFVYDLTRQPMLCRDLALLFRKSRATRHVPLVFVDGLPEKVERVREVLPDAAYTTWEELPHVLREVIANPPAVEVVPATGTDGYASSTAAKKLGLAEGIRVALVNAPAGFEEEIEGLPDGVIFNNGTSRRYDMVLWFAERYEDLVGHVDAMARVARAKGGLWILYPKKKRRDAGDLTQPAVIEIGRAAGLNVGKICAIGDSWSALRLSVPRTER
ncbi:MAG TPA: DUF3052 family protein [Candidatus Kapabacteria bacterium]|nr:DUF3052 family protein [Candidatus Kapabacteria bacterium]